MTPTKTGATPAYEVAPTATSTSSSYADLNTTIIIHDAQQTVKCGADRRAWARGRPPDAEPPDAATSGGSPESPLSPATSSGLGDSCILHQDSAAVYPLGHGGHEVVHRATKRDARGTLDDPRVQHAVIRCVSFEHRHYAIRSHSNPRAEHDVKWIDGRWVCSCMAGSRGARCFHQTAVHFRYLADAAEQTARLRRETERDWPELSRERETERDWPELSRERQAVLREQAEYGDSWLSGGVL